MKIIISLEQANQRLDKFLTNNQLFGLILNKQLSRQQIQKFIKQNLITINKQKAKSHYSIKENDLIIINDNIELLADEKLKKEFNIGQSQQKLLKIIAETDEYLVVNKPSGLIVHSGDESSITLADILAEQYPKLIKVGDDPARPGIVHRLDKEVSGLMVIAKTQDSFDNLKKQFQQRKIKKEYTALVYEKIDSDFGEISFPIRRASDGFKMAALPITKNKQINKDGRYAVTEFFVLKKFINYTLLKIKIKTGRTHQIRVHLLAFGHPIVGDNIYNTARTRAQNKKLNLNRVFLVANELAFTDLIGKEQKFIVDIPEQLKNLLKIIK